MILKFFLSFITFVQLVIPPYTLVLPFTAGTPFLQRWEIADRGFFYMEHTIWMALTAIHKNTLLKDCGNILFFNIN